MRLLALAVALLLAPQDEKITLKFNPQKGDKLTKSTKMEMKLKIEVEAGGETQEVEVEQRGTEKTVTEIVEVVDAKLTRIVVDCLEKYDEEKAPGAEWKRKDDPLHGRKITIFMKDGQLVREGAEGIEEKELKKLDLDDGDSHCLPKDPVKIGDSWELKGEDVRKYMDADDDIKDGKMKLKLVAVKEIDKRRCAMIQGTFELTGKVEGDLDLSLKFDADIVVWIDRGYTLSVKGKGKVTLKGENGEMSMNGEGPITIDLATKVE